MTDISRKCWLDKQCNARLRKRIVDPAILKNARRRSEQRATDLHEILAKAIDIADIIDIAAAEGRTICPEIAAVRTLASSIIDDLRVMRGQPTIR